MRTPTTSLLRSLLALVAFGGLLSSASLQGADKTATISGTNTFNWTTGTWAPTGLPADGDNIVASSTYQGGASNFHFSGDRSINILTLTGTGGTQQFRILNTVGSTVTATNTIINNRIVQLQASASGTYTLNTTNLTVDTGNNSYVLRLGTQSAGFARAVTLNVSGTTTVTSGGINIGVGGQSTNLGHLDLTTRTLLMTDTSFGLDGGTNVEVSVRSLTGSNGSTIGNSFSGTAVSATLKILGENTSDATYSGAIRDGGTVVTSVIKQGTGTQIFGGASNNYSGGTTISAGTLKIGVGGSLGTVGTGTITNNANLVFDRTNVNTVANFITGSGTVQQINTGSLVLTASNNYSGGTVISAGTVNIGDGGANGAAGTGGITNDSVLQVNRSDIYTLGNTISGTGRFRQIGAGTTILTANNTYTGATTVSSGTLQMGNGGATGLISTGSLTIGSGAGFIVNRNNSVTLSSIINGSGSFEQAGTGNTILGASSSSYDGNILVSSGTLNVGGGVSGGGLGNGTITNNATLVFQRTAGSNAGNILSGTGTLIFRGSSKYSLYNDSSAYAGNVTIESVARLQLGASPDSYASGALGGAITNNGELTIYRNNAFTFSNTVSGTGDLIKDGTGTTTLTAVSTYTGNTTVTAGTLVLDTGAGLTFKIGNNGVNNAIGGAGTLSLDGVFTFDLSGANTTAGNSWNIVNVGSLTESYGSNFSVAGFTEGLPGVWGYVDSGNTWTYTESTGILNVVPEPSTVLLAMSGLAAMLLRRRLRSRV